VKADVPGFKPEQLKVSVDGNTLCICGKDEQSQKGSKNNNDAQESSTTTRKIHCKVALPSNVDPKKAAASLDKGVLTLKLPKVDASTQIQVKSVQ
jgi:HSP20 family protein